YPGVDLLFYCGGDGLEYDIIVSPGADPSRVRIEVEGATSVKLTDDGQLTAETPSGTIRQIHPVIYQEIDGTRKPLAGGYRLEGHNRVGFVVDRYDPRGLLVIDPSVQFITILGGQPSTSTLGNAITVDSQGNSYITGVTSSPQFQTKKPFQKNLKGTNAFVTKLDPNGAIVYSTFLGGSVVDQGFGIAADSSGSAYILGLTLSPDFPTTAGAFQRVQAGQSDAFVSKLSPDGRSLAYSTLYGGSGSDNATGIALASGQGLPPGAVVITGGTLSADLPVKNAFQSTLGTAIQSGFVAAFDPSGSSLIYATYLGPTGVSNAAGAAIDGEGNAFIVGATISNTFPTTPGAFQTTEGFPGKAFVTKFSPTGSLAASTYFGGNATDSGVAISLTSDGSPVILINTTSTNLQSTLGSSFSGKGDAYTAGLDSNLTTYNFGGYIADSGMTTGLGLGSDTTTGQIAIVGKTDATDLASINAPTGLSLPVSGQTNAFAVVVDPTAATTRFSAAVVDQAVDTIPFSASWSFPNSQFCDAVGAGLRPGSFTVLCTSSSMSPPLARTPLVDIIGLQQPDVADLEIDPIFSDLVVKRTSAGDTVVQAYIKVVNNGPSSAQNVTLSVTTSCWGFLDAQAPAHGAQITHPAVG
ncbi:MAG TPA: SBBP repeat-containing protein, partial [Blastocatellia bacterium]|nr:SBBP repeat-containing protein [Blastocatellia bacterium]